MSVNTMELQQWRRSDYKGQTLETLRIALYVRPMIWCLQIYDDFWASKVRRPPDIHELARRARGESALDAPIPLPRKRKRTLTNPLPPLQYIHSISDTVRRSRQNTDDQAQSSFLTRIPIEIRLLIYAEAIAGGDDSVVHIIRKHGRLGFWRCRLQDGLELCDSKGLRCVEGWLSYKARVWHADRAGRLDLVTDSGLLRLLRTCRLIYSEAISVLYSRNVFHFYDPGDIRYFSRCILPQRLNAVQSIVMDWERSFSIFNPNNLGPKQNNDELKAWIETWDIIAGLQGLLELTVILKSHNFQVSKNRRMKMCQPMMRIKGLKVFQLLIPMDDESDWEFAANAPFKIVRGLYRSSI